MAFVDPRLPVYSSTDLLTRYATAPTIYDTQQMELQPVYSAFSAEAVLPTTVAPAYDPIEQQALAPVLEPAFSVISAEMVAPQLAPSASTVYAEQIAPQPTLQPITYTPPTEEIVPISARTQDIEEDRGVCCQNEPVSTYANDNPDAIPTRSVVTQEHAATQLPYNFLEPTDETAKSKRKWWILGAAVAVAAAGGAYAYSRRRRRR